jgi:hypothetical protein
MLGRFFNLGLGETLRGYSFQSRLYKPIKHADTWVPNAVIRAIRAYARCPYAGRSLTRRLAESKTCNFLQIRHFRSNSFEVRAARCADRLVAAAVYAQGLRRGEPTY